MITLFLQIPELHFQSTWDRKIIFVRVPGHAGTRGNSAAGSASKDAHNGDTHDELIPFSDLKPCVNKSLLELRQLEWDRCSHKQTKSFWNRRIVFLIPMLTEEKRLLSLDYSVVTHIWCTFLLRGEEPHGCDEVLNKTYAAFLFWFNWSREKYFTTCTFRMFGCIFGLHLWLSERGKNCKF